jgi:hypothetical protein
MQPAMTATRSITYTRPKLKNSTMAETGGAGLGGAMVGAPFPLGVNSPRDPLIAAELPSGISGEFA